MRGGVLEGGGAHPFMHAATRVSLGFARSLARPPAAPSPPQFHAAILALFLAAHKHYPVKVPGSAGQAGYTLRPPSFLLPSSPKVGSHSHADEMQDRRPTPSPPPQALKLQTSERSRTWGLHI